MENSYFEVADLYDHIVAYRARADVSFFVNLANEARGPVLELGCGTGRVLIPTARAGVQITGLDLSPQMLAVCREKLNAESSEIQSRVQLIESDLRGFGLPRQFALITIPFRPFQHLTEVADQLNCLAAIRSHLQDDGKVVIDVFNPLLKSLCSNEIGAEHSAGPDFELPDGRHVVQQEKINGRDLFKQIILVDLIYDVTNRDGRTERIVHPLRIRYFFRYEMEHLLARAGFKVEALYAGYQGEPFGTVDPGELIFVAIKK